jgi:hypothetical protein
VPFLGWLQARVVERRGTGAPEGAQVSWTRFEKDEPALADAAVRLHVAGLLDLPEDAGGIVPADLAGVLQAGSGGPG